MKKESQMEKAFNKAKLKQNNLPSIALENTNAALRKLGSISPPDPELQTKLVEIEDEVGEIKDRIEKIRNELSSECDTASIELALEEHAALPHEFDKTIKNIESIEELHNELRGVINHVEEAKSRLKTDISEFILFSCSE